MSFFTAAFLLLAGFSSSFADYPSVTLGRETDGGRYVEVCGGVAVSARHAVTLFAFTDNARVFAIKNGYRVYSDSTIDFRDMGLSMLFFDRDIFDNYELPGSVLPQNGAAQMIIANLPTGFRAVRTFPIERLSDGALLLASPPYPELMGAPVFDAYNRLAGIVTGSFDPGDGRGELTAMLPCNLWYFWVENVVTNSGANTPVFGVTAMPAPSTLSASQGILLLDVKEGSTAERCGLRKGDIITHIDGEQVYHPEALRAMLQTCATDLILSVVRDSELVEISVPTFN